jgi:hypothetical protein
METKGMVYRKRVLVFILSILLLSISSSLAYAQLQDQYFATQSEKLKVKKWFSDQDVSYGVATFDSDTSTFTLSDDTSGYFYTGTYSYINNGKTVRFVLDQDGLQEIVNMLANWAIDYGASEGMIVDVDTITAYVAISNAKVPKAGKKTKVTVTVSGTADADVDGIPILATFSYKCKITLVPLP